jgi:hypothetical protein
MVQGRWTSNVLWSCVGGQAMPYGPVALDKQCLMVQCRWTSNVLWSSVGGQAMPYGPGALDKQCLMVQCRWTSNALWSSGVGQAIPYGQVSADKQCIMVQLQWTSNAFCSDTSNIDPRIGTGKCGNVYVLVVWHQGTSKIHEPLLRLISQTPDSQATTSFSTWPTVFCRYQTYTVNEHSAG